jgi:hypothetical protein
MQTLQIDSVHAKKLFPTASLEFKQMLLDSFGEKFFLQKITDRIKTFDDACEVLGIRLEVHPKDTPDEIAYKSLKIICQALNEGWTPNWKNDNEHKYYPWFYMERGSGFSLGGVNYGCATSTVGSRLCFKSRDLAEYTVKTFLDLYKDYMVI